MGMDKNVKMIAIGIINGMFVCVCVRASLTPHHVGIIRCEIPFLFDPPLQAAKISTARACSKIPSNEERNRTHGQPKPAIEMKIFDVE